MKVALMVAEKPALALSISKFLSNGNLNSRKGRSGSCPIHEFEATLLGERVKIKMTSVCGHVNSLDFSGQYNNWDAIEPLELFSAPTVHKEANPKLHIVDHLASEGKGIAYLVLWLDCDKEGENICYEVIDAVERSKKLQENQILRAKFSSITKVDIEKAFRNLGKPNKNESLSVDARQELDLRLGCAFTRFQTKFFQGKYGDLDSNLISYGPCQTPTLGFCVERHDIIQTFTPEPYWVVEASIQTPNTKIPIAHERGRIFDQQVAHTFLLLVKRFTQATVKSVKRSTHKKVRPQAMNTVEMLRIASSKLGIGPSHTMAVAERLYTSGFISYPRTETNSYPDNFDLRGTLSAQKSSNTWGDYVTKLLSTGITAPRKGVDKGDHPPITPMRSASEGQLGSDEWRIYSLVTSNFIASLSPDCSYEKLDVVFTIGSEEFALTGSKVIDPGFTIVLHWQKMEDDLPPITFTKGEKYDLVEPRIVQKSTSAPGYLTEAELITLMEKHGIGTDASIPVHINNICERNFVSIESGRRLIPNTLGIVLVHGYQKIDPDLVKPTMRSEIEKQFELIAQGKAEYHLVLSHAVATFQAKFHYFTSNMEYMDQLFEASFTKLSETGKAISKCGRCGRYMKLILQKPTRLHCKNCEETYKLPQGGSIKLYQGNTCPLDQFELVVFNAGGKSYIICPYCYNFPEIEDMEKNSGCNRCPHPTCPNAAPQLSVTPCHVCNTGDLVIDPNSGPTWRMSCNEVKCTCVVKVFNGAVRVGVSPDEDCENCGSSILTVEYKPEKTPFKDGNKVTGCIICHPELCNLVELSKQQFKRRGRGRGRGRRRGRGGGRKPRNKQEALDQYFV